MNHNEGKFKTRDNLELYYQSWKPDSDSKAIVQIVHGIAEHGGRYTNVVDALIPAGFTVYIKDHRGHGKSDGRRGYTKSLNELVMDEKEFTDKIKELEKNKPIFLLGHSLGASISVDYISSGDGLILRGVILSGCGNKVGDVSPILKFIVKIMSKILPKLNVKNSLSEFVSRDPEVLKDYEDDPNNLKKGSARLGHETIKSFKENPKKIIKVSPDLPILMQAGGADRLILGHSELFELIPGNNKTLKIYEGLYHEIYNELEEDRKIVLNDLVNWLDSILEK